MNERELREPVDWNEAANARAREALVHVAAIEASMSTPRKPLDALRITTHTGVSLEGELGFVRVMIEQLSRYEGAYVFQGNWWNMERDDDGTITVSVRFQPDPDLAAELETKRHRTFSQESSNT